MNRNAIIAILFWLAVGGVVGLLSGASGVRVNGLMLIMAIVAVGIVYGVLYAIYEWLRSSRQPVRIVLPSHWRLHDTPSPTPTFFVWRHDDWIRCGEGVDWSYILERCASDAPGAFVITDGTRAHWDGTTLSLHHPFTPLAPLPIQEQ